MAYDSLDQHDHDLDDPDSDCDAEGHGVGQAKNSPGPRALNTSRRPVSQFQQPTAAAAAAVRALTTSNRSRSHTDSSYEIVEDDDYEDQQQDDDPTLTSRSQGRSALPISTPIPSKSSDNNPDNPNNTSNPLPNTRKPHPILPILLTAVPASSLALRHPTPVDDQRARLASYSDKIEHLERTAERLSMTSSIDDAIRDLHGALKRNDSRRSPLRSSPPDVTTIETRATAADAANPTIIDADHTNDADNNTTTQKIPLKDRVASITTSSSGLARSASKASRASKSSRFGSRPEPELEGRPLDLYVHSSLVSTASMAQPSPTAAQSPLEVTVHEDTYPSMDRQSPIKLQVRNPEAKETGEPSSPSSTYSYDAEKMFAGFDGAHAPPQQQQQHITIQEPVDALGISPRRSSFGALLTVDGVESNVPQRPARDRLSFAADPVVQRAPRMSSADRRSIAMSQASQAYEDPETGQQMLYYPAPVPVMLNLPQKLSKAPSSMARTKRRTQALSTVPAPARQTAIWLPDVLETDDQPHLPENDEAQQLEYMPQHQRMSMGGRRVTQDIQHLPPQLRASAFFDLPAPEQVVELKEQSAVATLDSILDASAHAPVTAFTDHLIAGHLGAEVYGQVKTPIKGPNRAPNRGSTANLLAPEETAPKKRTSAFNLLGRKTSGTNALDAETEKTRAAMIADIRAGKLIREDDEEEPAVSEPMEEPEEEQYQGAPTTLLAELQLRKQQQKHRTRPLITSYPNGLHSTLLQLDAVAQAEAESRKQKPVTLAWEGQSAEEREDAEDDEDVPLALIYAKNAQKAQALDVNRPLSLIERRDMEENEPLSRRRDRLQGKIPINRTSLLSVMPPPPPPPPEEEGETLAERLAILNGDEEGAATDLPKARPVSGDFASEMMSQFGGDLLDAEKDKPKDTPNDEEEETLGQRRKRLQAEALARAAEVGASAGGANTPSPAAERPDPYKRHSMANLLHVHPQAGAASMPFNAAKPHTGLLGLNQRMGATRSSSYNIPSRAHAGGFKGGMYNDGQAGTAPRVAPAPYNPYDTAALHQFPQPTLGAYGTGFGGGMGVGGFGGMPMPLAYLPQMQNTMAASMGIMNMKLNMAVTGQGDQPLNQGQIDMVERWRQSVMQ